MKRFFCAAFFIAVITLLAACGALNTTTAAAQAVTIVGIPLAIANLKMIPITCFPFGKVVVNDPAASIL